MVGNDTPQHFEDGCIPVDESKDDRISAEDHSLQGVNVFHGQPDMSCEAEWSEDDEEETKPTFLELFYDLVFVVVLHKIATGLEEEETIPRDTVWAYCLRVFMAWWSWHMTATWTNLCSYLTSDYHVLHYVAILLQGFGMALMSSAATDGDNDLFLGFYLGTRVVNLIAWGYLVSQLVASQKLPQELNIVLHELVKITSVFLLVEFAVYIPAAVLANTGSHEESLLLWLGGVLFTLSMRTIGGWKHDQNTEEVKKVAKFKLDHLEERYGLLVIILLGEIVASSAAVSSKDGFWVYFKVFSAVLTAFMAFLLYFEALPKGRWNAQRVSNLASMHWTHSHFCVACCLAALGSGFARLMEEGDHHDKAHASSILLLCISAGLFLLFSASFVYYGRDVPPGSYLAPPRLNHCQRSLIRCFGGVLILFWGTIQGYEPTKSTVSDWKVEATCAVIPSVMFCSFVAERWGAQRGEQERIAGALLAANAQA